MDTPTAQPLQPLQMNPEQLEELRRRFFPKWVEALRSGDFVQTQGRLVRLSADEKTCSYCCLGVGCVVAKELGVSINETMTGPNPTRAAVPHGPVERLMGHNNPNLRLTPTLKSRVRNREYLAAVELNDSYKASFEEIADAIEKTYPQYFGVAKVS